MNTVRGRSRVWFSGAFALAALFALLAPTAGLFANPQLAGWESGHGHAGSAAAVANHTHPYDANSGADRPASDQVASDVTFTPSDDAGAAPALLLGREPAPLPAPAAAVAAPRPRPVAALEGFAAGVPTPPPRA